MAVAFLVLYYTSHSVSYFVDTYYLLTAKQSAQFFCSKWVSWYNN